MAQDDDLFGDDTLLFGEEFDLGEDFDLDLGGEDDLLGTEAESGGEELEDWMEGLDFGEEGVESGTEEALEDTAAADDWGFITEGEDYEDLIKRSAEGEDLFEESDHPLNFSKAVEGTILEDTGFTLSFFSPQYVADTLDTWYSFMDFSLTVDFPWHIERGTTHILFSLEIASFNFENTFPAGGTFTGVSVVPMARLKLKGIETEFGAGLFYPSFGMMAGAGFSYKFESIFFSAGYRWNWVSDIDPIGTGWWIEPRFTLGIKFW